MARKIVNMRKRLEANVKVFDTYEDEGGFWATLRKGWSTENGEHSVVEGSWAAVVEKVEADVTPCECDECLCHQNPESPQKRDHNFQPDDAGMSACVWCGHQEERIR